MTTTTPRIRGHLSDVPDGHTLLAEPHGAADRLRDRSADDEAEEHDRGHDDEEQGEQEDDGAQLPHRPSLVDLVDAVHGPAEGPDVARRAPQRAREADGEREPGLRCPDHRRDRFLEPVGDLGLAQLAQDVEHRVGRLLALAEHAEQADEGQDRGEDRQHRVVGQRSGEVGALVALELRERGLGGVPPPRRLDVRRGLGLGRGVRGRCGLRALGGCSLSCHGPLLPRAPSGHTVRGPVVGRVRRQRNASTRHSGVEVRPAYGQGTAHHVAAPVGGGRLWR